MSDHIEKLADIEHERWADWQRYLHSLCVKNPDGSLTIPADRVERWERQIATEYDNLSDAEKESDREQVRRYLHLVSERLTGDGPFAETNFAGSRLNRDEIIATIEAIYCHAPEMRGNPVTVAFDSHVARIIDRLNDQVGHGLPVTTVEGGEAVPGSTTVKDEIRFLGNDGVCYGRIYNFSLELDDYANPPTIGQLNAAYAERDRLAALLSKVFPAHLVEATDKSPGWQYVVIIDLPTGQISFHVSDAEASELFDHLEFRDNDWDSHSNEEKWQRVLAMPPHPTPKTIVNSFRWHEAHRTREVEHDGV